MLLAYYLFALLCNLVWVLDTLTHTLYLVRSAVLYTNISIINYISSREFCSSINYT